MKLPNLELCDIQNEEATKLIYELRVGLKRLHQYDLYELGKGPNPSYHDSGSGDLSRVLDKKKERTSASEPPTDHK